MTSATVLIRRVRLGFAFAAILFALRPLGAQEHPVKRVANIVTVALEEYAKGIDERGRMISAQEYQEAVDFLTDARRTAERLPGARGDSARVLLDSIVVAVQEKRPPLVTGEEGRAVVELFTAIYQSSKPKTERG